jgi:hypothetical protein
MKQFSSLLFRLHSFTNRDATFATVLENNMFLWKGHECDLANPNFFLIWWTHNTQENINGRARNRSHTHIHARAPSIHPSTYLPTYLPST